MMQINAIEWYWLCLSELIKRNKQTRNISKETIIVITNNKLVNSDFIISILTQHVSVMKHSVF